LRSKWKKYNPSKTVTVRVAATTKYIISGGNIHAASPVATYAATNLNFLNFFSHAPIILIITLGSIVTITLILIIVVIKEVEPLKVGKNLK
jgi:hypothetical protein